MTKPDSAVEETGFENNDNEHATLLRALDNFRSLDANNNKALLQGFDEITTIARLHFCNEEKLMQKAGYQPLEDHQREHQKLLKTITKYRQRLIDEEGLAQQALWEFLLDWVTHHANKEDLEFKTYYYKIKIENN